tara:strand:- start:747 stop:1283 length:537 start_codon:yes stop_codon:yes gene_type:complete
MRLVYSIPNKLWWIHDFLDKETYQGIHNAIIKERKKINLGPAKDHWSDDLINNLISPQVVGVRDYKPFEKLKILVRNNPFFKFDKNVEKMISTIHFLNKGSGINWHNDHLWKYGCSYYLNNKWSTQWGGEFMFADEKAHGFIPIIGNSLVIIKSPFQHKVNTVLSPIMPRISVQIFMR